MLSSILTAFALLHTINSASAFAATTTTAITTTSSSSTSTTSAASPTVSLALNAMTAVGCYSSSGGMSSQGTWTWQTSGYCQPICVGLGMPVMGLSNGTTCWCGSSLPPASSKVSDALCNMPCDGYPDDKCGGANAWTVILSGMTNNVGTAADSSSLSIPGSSVVSSSISSLTNLIPTASGSGGAAAAAASITSVASVAPVPTPVTTVAPVTVTVGGSTVVRTVPITTTVPSATSTAAAATAPSSHSSSKAGLAAGVVVGIIALAAIIGGVYFYMRRRRSQAAASPSGHRRNTSLNAFASPPPPPGAVPRPTTVNLNDSRLDPTIMQEKRQSGVSIFADNFDYSRRILKVANPDRL